MQNPTVLARPPLTRLAALLLAIVLALSGANVFGAPLAAHAASSSISFGQLTVNARVNPIGIPTDAPSFGWQLASDSRAATQSAYQVQVGHEPGGSDAWDSGRVTSDDQADVVYQGAELTSSTRYYWQVRVWDGSGAESSWSEPQWFETGLADASDWGDAAWIGNASPPEANSWTDYTATMHFTLDSGSFGVFMRASDVNNAYMIQLSTRDGNTPKLRPHLKQNGNFSLIKEIDLGPLGFTNDGLRAGTHTLSITASGSTISTTLDDIALGSFTDSTFSKGFVGFRTYYWDNASVTIHDLAVTAAGGATLMSTSFAGSNPFTDGQLVPGGVKYTGSIDAIKKSSDSNLPLLRKDLNISKPVASARLYASAHGVYRLSINGTRVGDQELAPGWTQYTERTQSQTYDVTSLLSQGANAIGAELGAGWWAGTIGLNWPEQYGHLSDVALIARLHVTYTDGSDDWIDSDDSWTSAKGPFELADLQEGESYNAGLLQDGWDSPGFTGAGWTPARVTSTDVSTLVPQPDDPVRVTQKLPAKVRTEPTPGTYVYDLGQNMVGVSQVTLTGTTGQTVQIRYAEVLNPDGTLYTANLRTAKATDYYTFGKDGTITYTPTFTQHGFRYIEITGVPSAPSTADVTGIVWGSDLRSTGTISTSDGMLNQLASNISWGQRGNFLSIPTDTPARDERLGWTGDIGLFAPTASYLVDARAFLSKWMADVRDAQYADGNLPSVIPHPNDSFSETGIAWSDAMITVPYALWHGYGDAQVLRENWAAMSKFFNFVVTSAGDDHIETGRATWFSQDWLNLDDPTPIPVLGTAYLAEDARMMSEMAAAVGDTANAQAWSTLSAQTRQAFTNAFVAADGTVQGDAQTGYALALGMNLVVGDDLKAKVGEKYIAKLQRTDFHLTTGFVGTPMQIGRAHV